MKHVDIYSLPDVETFAAGETMSKPPHVQEAQGVAPEPAEYWRERAEKAEGEADLNGSAIMEIRRLLTAAGVPPAAFVDDHVGNAVVMRNQERARAESAERALADSRAEVEHLSREGAEKDHELARRFGEVERLREVLEKYAHWHLTGCSSEWSDDCNCGLSAALAPPEETP